jgi:uncharacterized protein (UPF0179 family)
LTPTIYTLLSPSVARLGYSFEFLGESEPCGACRHRKSCIGKLENGEVYSVIKVGKNRLECPLIGQQAAVAQIRLAPRLLAVSSRSAVEGMNITVQADDGLPCGEECLCLPAHVKIGKRYIVERIVKKTFECPYGSSRSLVEVSPA